VKGVAALSRSTVQSLRLLVVLVAISAAGGGFYAFLGAESDAGRAVVLATGALIGVAISCMIIAFELFGARHVLAAPGRRLPFMLAALVRAAVYGAAIVASLLLIPWWTAGIPPTPGRPGFIEDIAFSLAATFVMVSLMSIAQLIGPGTLLSVVTGRYWRPREEMRIVLFIDLVDSTSIAERIGSVRFHALLSETFAILSTAVADHGGEVHRYVGDALIATWPVADPVANALPVAFLFASEERLKAAAPSLHNRHGAVPGFRGALHAGPLVVGEIGGFKREIAFLGDAMNTTARLEQVCRQTGRRFVASEPFLALATIPAGIKATRMGEHRLRGKAGQVSVFALERLG
jgi:adenylate cyclase